MGKTDDMGMLEFQQYCAEGPSFGQWMKQQVDRNDPIGDLAKDLVSIGFPAKFAEWMRQLNDHAASSAAKEALNDAALAYWREVGFDDDYFPGEYIDQYPPKFLDGYTQALSDVAIFFEGSLYRSEEMAVLNGCLQRIHDFRLKAAIQKLKEDEA